MEPASRDFFISYTGVDSAWASWIAVTLEQAGFTVLLQEWDFLPGADFIHLMDQAASEGMRTIAVLSTGYLASEFGAAEWRAAFEKDPSGERKLLIPVLVERCKPRGILASRISIDLIDVGEEAARRLLLSGVAPGVRPTTADFPGAATALRPTGKRRPHFPGSEPATVGEPSRATRRSDADDATHRNGAGMGPAPGNEPWEWLSRNRQPIRDLLGDNVDMVGHHQARQTLGELLDDSDTAALVVLTGVAGSGKSWLLRWLDRVAEKRVVNVRAALARMTWTLRRDGSDVHKLLRELSQVVKRAGDHPVLVFDDVDHELREEGITRFASEAIAELDLGIIVLSTSTAWTPQLFPIPVTELRLDQRRADFEEFDRFLDKVLDAADAERGGFSDDLRRSLHDMSEQTSDFQDVEYVVEMLLAQHQLTGDVTHPAVLRRLLDGDQEVRNRQLPAVRARRGLRLTFRRKDKSELLTEVLLRHFPTPQQLADAADRELDDFDPKAFLSEARKSFGSAVMPLCLTYSPRDLVLKLLHPEQIQQEIDLLKLDSAQLFDEQEEKAFLLIRGLGFTLVDTPNGLRAFKDSVQATRELVENQDARTDVLNAAGVTVIQHVGAALLDLLHFWATYLFGSVRDLVKLVNNQNANGAAVDGRRLTTRDVIVLLRYLDTSAEAEESAYRLSFPEGHEPVPPALLEACEKFARRAEVFQPATGLSAAAATAVNLRIRCRGLVDAAAEVLRASDDSFPAVIKISEIIFDEYSRKIFRGVDSDDNEVRFAFTDNDDRDDLVVAAHYFMLPKKPVNVDPHIVPRGGTAAPVLFDRAKAYQDASSTQRDQGSHLLDFVELRPGDEVLEVGVGTGLLAIQIGARVCRVRGIDHSPDMVRQAAENALTAESTNVTFEVADLLEYDPGEVFDVVLSNSTMHWIVPEDRAYRQLYLLLRRGGRLGVHQGGHGNYKGLREHTVNLLRTLGYGKYFQGWRYPLYYPTADEYKQLLERVGFENVKVIPAVSDGSEYPNLIRDFSEAGLLPYLNKLPEIYRDSFRAEWLDEAEHSLLDFYTHRLYAVATRP